MRRVLFMLDNLEGGGAERVFVNIANGFVKHGITVEMVLGKKQGIYLPLLHPSIKVSETGGTNFFHSIRAFRKIFKHNNYSHIITAGHYISAAAIIAKKLTGTSAKIYQTHHYSHPTKREFKYLVNDLLLKSVYYFTAPDADKIIAVSKGSLQWLRDFSRRKLPQGICIYNPVFDETIYTLGKMPVDFPVDVTGKKILLNVGRLSEQKDQLTLIQAFMRYREQYENAVLFILGTGPLEKTLSDHIVANGLQNEVILTGFQQNPFMWMARCDVFILSSKYEGFGNVIVEAMVFGKTVVSTDCPSGPAEILENGRLGYLCPVQDPPAMAASIARAVRTPLDPKMIMHAAQQYSAANIVQQYINML